MLSGQSVMILDQEQQLREIMRHSDSVGFVPDRVASPGNNAGLHKLGEVCRQTKPPSAAILYAQNTTVSQEQQLCADMRGLHYIGLDALWGMMQTSVRLVEI